MRRRCLALVLSLTSSAFAFEKLAQLDFWDYNGVFDIETADGLNQVVEHVRRTGADTMLVRINGGSTVLYHSPAEDFTPYNEQPLDLRRLPDGRQVAGRLRLHGAPGVDAVATLQTLIRARGLNGGLYWPYEENHWHTSKVSIWNLDHPQYWCVNEAGVPWWGRCSSAFAEVREHKLRGLDEVLQSGGDTLYVEAWRTGGWSPAEEYVQPCLAKWRHRYPKAGHPAADDPRWRALVAEVNLEFFRGVRRHLDAAGRKMRFLFGIHGVDLAGDRAEREKAIDWRQLAEARLIDGLVVVSVVPDRRAVWESTEAIYQQVAAQAKARGLPVFFPVSMYCHDKWGIPTYMEATGGDAVAVTRQLLQLAARAQGDGILMECVDFGNYSEAMATAIRDFQP